jgi:hypothetical protein
MPYMKQRVNYVIGGSRAEISMWVGGSQIFWVAVGLERGPLSPCESKWGATSKKSSGSGLENWD